jgi:hypothetical protein
LLRDFLWSEKSLHSQKDVAIVMLEDQELDEGHLDSRPRK